MSDLLDQLSDAQATAAQAKKSRTTHVTTFAYQVDGEWFHVTYDGPLSDCNEAFLEKVTEDGVQLDKIRWARGFMDGKRLVVHPKRDAEAEAKIKEVMATEPEPIQLAGT